MNFTLMVGKTLLNGRRKRIESPKVSPSNPCDSGEFRTFVSIRIFVPPRQPGATGIYIHSWRFRNVRNSFSPPVIYWGPQWSLSDGYGARYLLMYVEIS